MAQPTSARSPDHPQLTGLTTPLPSSDPGPSVPGRSSSAPPTPVVAGATPAAAPLVSTPVAPARKAPPVRPVPDEKVCDLCGAQLDDHSGHYHMVSPLTARKVAVCRTCRRAALGEGYRPRA